MQPEQLRAQLPQYQPSLPVEGPCDMELTVAYTANITTVDFPSKLSRSDFIYVSVGCIDKYFYPYPVTTLKLTWKIACLKPAWEASCHDIVLRIHSYPALWKTSLNYCVRINLVQSSLPLHLLLLLTLRILNNRWTNWYMIKMFLRLRLLVCWGTRKISVLPCRPLSSLPTPWQGA